MGCPGYEANLVYDNNNGCCVCCRFSPGARSAASIILRGANDFMVDEMERSVHDALCVVKRVLESNLVVPGGGAVETALSIFLENFATSIVSVCSLYQALTKNIFISKALPYTSN